jgi:MoaA/NifB/PqqE/SkfB family radical SAM enzyme
MAAESAVYYGDNRGRLTRWDEPKLRELEESIAHLRRSGVVALDPQMLQTVFIREMVRAHRMKRRTYDCFAGSCFVFIDGDGNIRPCNMLDYTFGNIARDDLLQAFRSEQAKEARRYVGRRACFCWIECETFNSWGTADWLGIPIRDQLKIYETAS